MLYEEIREDLREKIKKVAGEKIALEEIEESQQGDFTFKTFSLAKKRKKKPREVAQEISQKISVGNYLEGVEAVGPYVNFFLNYSHILPQLEKINSKYGKFPRKEKKIILEHTSINPSGPIHIGRLRNSLLGDSLARILKFYGHNVETHYYVNDIGKQIAIIQKGFEKGLKPDREIVERYKRYQDKKDFQTFFQYVKANEKFEQEEEFQREVQKQIRKAESGDEEALDKISEVGKECLEGQKETFHRLGIRFDSFDFESKYVKNGSVEDILHSLKKNEYAQETEGGFGLNLEGFGLKRRGGVTILARKDGTSVYLSRDICYHLEKAKLGDHMLNVLGEDHKFEFLEVKTILQKILQVSTPLEVLHYSFVSFEGKELSTRKGKTAPIDQLIDESIEKAAQEIEKRGIAEKKVAPMIGIGAIKYHLLKTSPEKPLTFQWEEALNFEGDSCPYLQYSHARSCSILRKAGEKEKEIGKKNIMTEEKALMKEIIKFPPTVEKAAQEWKPNLIAHYLYKISTEFNRFYKKCQVLGVEKGTENRRLLMVNATRIVLKNGLNLLGIEAPQKM